VNAQSTHTHLIPEWAGQSAVFLAWPHAEGDFTPWLPAVEKTYVHIAAEVARQERLIVACRGEDHRRGIEDLLVGHGVDLASVRFVCMPYNDVWVRDTAPLSVEAESAGTRLLDFRFNGWGGKYQHADDAAIARRLHESGALGTTPLDPVNFVLEGGSIETDGAGTIMTTTRCLLNPNRNPSLSKARIEAELASRLGADQVLWLEHGHAEGDDTDAHVDTLARFCSPKIIAYTACEEPDDPLYAEFTAMAAQLATFRNRVGQTYHLVPLPIPAPIRSEEGDRLPATYANFLIINDAVLVPVYNDPADRIALERLAACFPDREIVAIDCVPLIRQYGSLHCMTMQFPSSIRVA
jgi:agmatine/peptidylarginine deiminase